MRRVTALAVLILTVVIGLSYGSDWMNRLYGDSWRDPGRYGRHENPDLSREIQRMRLEKMRCGSQEYCEQICENDKFIPDFIKKRDEDCTITGKCRRQRCRCYCEMNQPQPPSLG